MLRHPIFARSKISQPDEKMIQPNTIDLRVNKVFELENTLLVSSESSKTTRKFRELIPDPDGIFGLQQGKAYQLETTTYIEMSAGEIGLVIGRSTFNRNGVLLMSSVYDSGFKDFVGATLYNIAGPTQIERNSRVAHLMLFDAEAYRLYDGQYGNQGK